MEISGTTLGNPVRNTREILEGCVGANPGKILEEILVEISGEAPVNFKEKMFFGWDSWSHF